MAIEVTVPRLGWSMDEGTFVEWLKAEGEWVRAGDMLFVLEGEKAAQEIESFDEGFLWLGEDSPQPGTTVEVGQLLAHLLAEGEDAPQGAATTAAVRSSPAQQSSPVAAAAAQPAEPAEPVVAPPASGGRIRVSPRARRVARDLGVDYRTLKGSGGNGRIREADVLAADLSAASTVLASTSAASETSRHPDEGTSLPMTRIRRTIAERMVASVNQTAPVTLTTTADASALVDTRNSFKSDPNPQHTCIPSFTDMIVHLAAGALQRHPILRGQWSDDSIWIPDAIDISIAVDTQAGLFAPVVRDVSGKSLHQLAREVVSLAEQARNQQMPLHQLQGGVFTVTNLGSYGIDGFNPIINLPQSAILGIGRVRREPRVVDNGFVASWMMTLSLTFDHRVMDGADAARFLDDLRGQIEQSSF